MYQCAFNSKTVRLPFSLTDEVIEKIFKSDRPLEGRDWLGLARANIINLIYSYQGNDDTDDEDETLTRNRPRKAKAKDEPKDDYMLQDSNDESFIFLSQLRALEVVLGLACHYQMSLFAIYPFDNCFDLTFTCENKINSDEFIANVSASVQVWLIHVPTK